MHREQWHCRKHTTDTTKQKRRIRREQRNTSRAKRESESGRERERGQRNRAAQTTALLTPQRGSHGQYGKDREQQISLTEKKGYRYEQQETATQQRGERKTQHTETIRVEEEEEEEDGKKCEKRKCMYMYTEEEKLVGLRAQKWTEQRPIAKPQRFLLMIVLSAMRHPQRHSIHAPTAGLPC
jgi:hypothetical protein